MNGYYLVNLTSKSSYFLHLRKCEKCMFMKLKIIELKMLSVLNVPIVEEHQEVIVQKDLESVAPVSL